MHCAQHALRHILQVSGRPVSLLQLATSSTCLLLRLLHTGIPPSAHEILSDPKLMKTGVGVSADLRKISEQQGCVAKGHVELQARTRRIWAACGTPLATWHRSSAHLLNSRRHHNNSSHIRSRVPRINYNNNRE